MVLCILPASGVRGSWLCELLHKAAGHLQLWWPYVFVVLPNIVVSDHLGACAFRGVFNYGYYPFVPATVDDSVDDDGE